MICHKIRDAIENIEVISLYSFFEVWKDMSSLIKTIKHDIRFGGGIQLVYRSAAGFYGHPVSSINRIFIMYNVLNELQNMFSQGQNQCSFHIPGSGIRCESGFNIAHFH